MAEKKEKKVRNLRTVKRDTASERIGRVGHRSLANRFEEIHWVPAGIDPDKGEDLLVRIYEKDRFTGLHFYAQIKSTDNLEDMLDASTGDVKFKADTKDLDHWNASGIPIFLFVWDIKTKSGFWIEISDAFILQLDATKEDWRSQETVTIHIPSANQTDDSGLHRVHEIVAERFQPMYEKNKSLKLQLKAEFPDTPEGKRISEQMRRWHEAGDSVTLTAPYIKEFVASDWYERLHGPLELTDGTVITLSSVPSDKDMAVRFRVLTQRGRQVAALNTVVRVIKRGECEMTLTNEHHPTPFVYSIILRDEEGGIRLRVNITVKDSKPTAQEAFDALPFWKGLSAGGTLAMSMATPEKNLELSTPFGPGEWPEPLEEEERAIVNLSVIGKLTGVNLPLPGWTLTYKDDSDAQQLRTILETGRVIEDFERQSFTLGEPKSTADAKELINLLLKIVVEKRRFNGGIGMLESEFELLKAIIPLGPARYDFEGDIAPESAQELQAASANPESVTELTITLINGQIVRTFEQWLPDSEESSSESDDEDSKHAVNLKDQPVTEKNVGN